MENLLLLDIRRDGKTSCLYRMRNPLVVRLSMEAETHPQSVVREHSKERQLLLLYSLVWFFKSFHIRKP